MSILKKLLSATLFIFICVSAYSQSDPLSVASFALVEKDLTANLVGTIKFDQNGEKCALIKIETTQHGFLFDAGSLGITEIEEQNEKHPGEIWLYVPHGVKKLTIQHPQLGTIRDYDLGLSVRKGRTYLMKLTGGQVNTIVMDYDNSQNLAIKVFPSDAVVYINGVHFETDAMGVLEKPLSFGTYYYRVTATNYHTKEGQIVINDLEHKQELFIRLKPAFGYVSIKDSLPEFENADVYIDSVFVGKTPIADYHVPSGVRDVYIKKKLYKAYTQTISVRDSSFTTITPSFEPNYAEVTISAPEDDPIYADGEFMAKGHWHGLMEAGEHSIEVRREAHSPAVKTVNFVSGEEARVKMDNPQPIYGSLNVVSSPGSADVYVDDKRVGRTPYIVHNVLIGEHKIDLRKKGHRPETTMVNIEEGQTFCIEKQLTNVCTSLIESNVQADVFVNNTFVGTTPYRLNHDAGRYSIKLKASYRPSRYTKYSDKKTLNADTKDMKIKLRRNYVMKNEFYFNIGYNHGGLKSWNLGMGGFMNHFNLEANFKYASAKSESLLLKDEYNYLQYVSFAPLGANIRMGGGIRLNRRIRIAPQIGVQAVMLLSEYDYSYHGNSAQQPYIDCPGYDQINCGLSVSVGARVSFAFASWLGISFTPEYCFPVFQTPNYEILSEVSPTIASYNSKGFQWSANLNIFF